MGRSRRGRGRGRPGLRDFLRGDIRCCGEAVTHSGAATCFPAGSQLNTTQSPRVHPLPAGGAAAPGMEAVRSPAVSLGVGEAAPASASTPLYPGSELGGQSCSLAQLVGLQQSDLPSPRPSPHLRALAAPRTGAGTGYWVLSCPPSDRGGNTRIRWHACLSKALLPGGRGPTGTKFRRGGRELLPLVGGVGPLLGERNLERASSVSIWNHKVLLRGIPEV